MLFRMNDAKKDDTEDDNYWRVGTGVFILVASVLSLGEYFGYVPKEMQWGLPTIGIICGVVMLCKAFAKKR